MENISEIIKAMSYQVAKIYNQLEYYYAVEDEYKRVKEVKLRNIKKNLFVLRGQIEIGYIIIHNDPNFNAILREQDRLNKEVEKLEKELEK